MDWHQLYSQLTEKDKEEFSRLVSQLFEQTFLVRDVWEPKEHRVVGNRDYRFAERHLQLLKKYLTVSGFEIQSDGRHGVIAIYNKYERNKIKVDKPTTYLLYALRLVYEEQMETASMRREIVVPLREIVGKLNTIGLLEKRLTNDQLQSAFNRLRKWSIVARVQGTTLDAESRWMIYPTITLAVSDERINNLFSRFAEGEFTEGLFEDRENRDESATDEDDEDSFQNEELEEEEIL